MSPILWVVFRIYLLKSSFGPKDVTSLSLLSSPPRVFPRDVSASRHWPNFNPMHVRHGSVLLYGPSTSGHVTSKHLSDATHTYNSQLSTFQRRTLQIVGKKLAWRWEGRKQRKRRNNVQTNYETNLVRNSLGEPGNFHYTLSTLIFSKLCIWQTHGDPQSSLGWLPVTCFLAGLAILRGLLSEIDLL